MDQCETSGQQRHVRRAWAAWVLACLTVAGCATGTSPAPSQSAGRYIVFDATLWRAARETLAALPVEQADPLAGRLVTGWAEPRGGTGQTRNRVTVGLNYETGYARAVIVTVERQRLGPDGRWIGDGTDDTAATALATAISDDAGELRLAKNHPS